MVFGRKPRCEQEVLMSQTIDPTDALFQYSLEEEKAFVNDEAPWKEEYVQKVTSVLISARSISRQSRSPPLR